MRRLFILCSFLFLCTFLTAQTTVVTATVTSPDGFAFANGTVTAILTGSTGNINCALYKVNGVQMGGPTTPCTVAGTMNGSGTFTLTLNDDHLIQPSGTIWAFTVCGQATNSCSVSYQDVFGSSINLSVLISNSLPPIAGPAQALPRYYSNAEASNSGVGSQYWNLTTNTVNMCIALPCSNNANWVSGGGGGGGSGTVGPGTQYQIPIYAATGTTVIGDTLLTDTGTLGTYGGSGGFSITGAGGLNVAGTSGGTFTGPLTTSGVNVTGSGAFVFGGTYGNFSTPGTNLSRCGFWTGGVFACSENNGAIAQKLSRGGVAGSDITSGSIGAAYIGDLSSTYVTQTEVASAGGVASLDTTGNVPATQLGNVTVVGNNYVLYGFCSGPSGGSNLTYFMVPGSTGTSTGCSNSTGIEMPIASAGTLKNLYVNAVHAGSNASNVVVYVNGVATGLTCSIASGTTCSDTVHTANVSQGNTWSVRYVPGGTSDTAQGIHASFQVAVSAGYTELAWCPGTSGTSSAIYVLLPSSSGYNCANTLAAEMPIPVTGTATNLYVNAGTQGSNSSNVTLYINGVATTLTCSIATATTCNDQIHQIPFNAGSTWSVRYAPGGTSDTAANILVSFQVF